MTRLIAAKVRPALESRRDRNLREWRTHMMELRQAAMRGRGRQ